ncbi:MAG TPA: aminoglycoside phosphotransferase family protein [Gemmataceae bacterium]|nr:aminoglycoside phosphotransferase family protein [Gemmataceae bacterium]
MIELTAANAVEYLRGRGFLGPGPAHAEPLGGGVSNAVLRVVTPERRFVLKQSRPQLRTRDAWFSDLGRVWREQEVMQALGPLLPPLTVPEVLFTDRENYVFVMSHAPDDARVWKEALLAGETDAALARRVGAVLGTMHAATHRDRRLVEPFRDHEVFIQLRVDPFYYRVQERRPEAAAAIAPVVERMLTVKEGLCHGDYTPKNILAHGQGFTLVDYETAHWGDPTMDLGLCLAHLTLKAFRRPGEREAFFALVRSLWAGYRTAGAGLPLDEWEARGVEHLGVCLLARIDGTSPVDYLPEEPKREAVRRLGRRLLWDRPRRWEEALGMAGREMAGLA